MRVSLSSSPSPAYLRSKSRVTRKLAILKRAMTEKRSGWSSKDWQTRSGWHQMEAKACRINGNHHFPVEKVEGSFNFVGELLKGKKSTWPKSCKESLKRYQEVLVLADELKAQGNFDENTRAMITPLLGFCCFLSSPFGWYCLCCLLLTRFGWCCFASSSSSSSSWVVVLSPLCGLASASFGWCCLRPLPVKWWFSLLFGRCFVHILLFSSVLFLLWGGAAVLSWVVILSLPPSCVWWCFPNLLILGTAASGPERKPETSSAEAKSHR